MTKCAIVWCGAKKNNKNPNLTVHRFPKNAVSRKKWLDAIGAENIRPTIKEWFICSLHFEESLFNRTLDVIRLRDDAVPTIFNYPRIQRIGQCVNSKSTHITTERKSDLTRAKITTAHLNIEPCSKSFSTSKVEEELKIARLKQKCGIYKLKIKCLYQNVKRRDKKIEKLKSIIKELKKKN